mgnify:CR=1 FL=1
MSIQRGDFVRPRKTSRSLPRDSVWRVVCADGALKLEPENGRAQRVSRCAATDGRFPAQDFDKVVRCHGQWVSVSDAELLLGPTWCFGDDVITDRMASIPSTPINWKPAPEPAQRLTHADDVDRAAFAARQAASATAAMDRLLEDARKLEAERQEELRIAKAAKAKADKEAAARAKMDEARKALAAKLYADRCLAEATLGLIAEVSRLNNGRPEQVADASIAQHIDQLQPLAKSYGYRIAKPSMLAQVVKL